MTLIEVTIVSGIMIVLALFMATFMENSRRAQKSIEAKTNVTSVGSNLSAAASQPAAVVRSMGVMD